MREVNFDAVLNEVYGYAQPEHTLMWALKEN